MYTYANIELPYPDAKIASYLCKGGPIRYHLVHPNINDEWILQHVSPNIKKRFNNTVCLCLGKALLWAIFAAPDELPAMILQRIMNAYAHLPNFNGNPIKKIPIIVTGDQGRVHMDDVPDVQLPQGGGGGGGAAATGAANFIDRPIREQLLALHSSVSSLRRGQTSITDKIEQTRAEQRRNFTTIKSSIQRIANTPARLIGTTRNNNNNNNTMTMAATNQVGRPAVLAMPRDLYQLWNEYTQGLQGNKPASQFTTPERGRWKHKYTRRKVFWDFVKGMINAGQTINIAIDRLYQVYGRDKSVTAIINQLRRDRNANRLHVALRV